MSLKPGVDLKDVTQRAAASVAARQMLVVHREPAEYQRPPTAAPGPAALHHFRRSLSGPDRPDEAAGLSPLASQLQAQARPGPGSSRASSGRSDTSAAPGAPEPPARPASSRPPLVPSPPAHTSSPAPSPALGPGPPASILLAVREQQQKAEAPGPASSDAPSTSMPRIGGVAGTRARTPSASGPLNAPSPAREEPGAPRDFETWREELESVLVALGTQEAIMPAAQPGPGGGVSPIPYPHPLVPYCRLLFSAIHVTYK